MVLSCQHMHGNREGILIRCLELAHYSRTCEPYLYIETKDVSKWITHAHAVYPCVRGVWPMLECCGVMADGHVEVLDNRLL